MSHYVRQNESYIDRVIRLIPAEIVATHLAVQGLVVNNPGVRNPSLEASAVVLLLVLPLYLWRLHGIRSGRQILLTMGSFIVWVCAVSFPVYTRWSFDPVWASVALVLWTTVIPVFHSEER